MDKWKVAQVIIVSGILTSEGAAVLWKHPGMDDNHKESKSGPGEPIGRNASLVAVTTSTSVYESTNFQIRKG